MSEPLRDPPYPADTRAKGWRFELDYEKIEQSDTWDIASEVPLAQQCLLLMWYVAWKQEPCGSLPGDEATIRVKCKVPVKLWPSVAPVLMRGWWLASDGRLYHDTITARVVEMLEYRRKTAERVAKHKAAMREQREGNALPTGEQTVKNDTGTGTGTGTIKEVSRAKALSSAEPTGKTPTIPCPYEAIVAAYHELLPGLPKVRLLDGKTWIARQKAMRTVWGWVLSSKKPDGTRRAQTGEEAIDWLRAYFARAYENDFLMGRTERSAKHAGWRCDFDFLLTDAGLKHVVEKTQDAA